MKNFLLIMMCFMATIFHSTEVSAEEIIIEADGYYFIVEGEGDFSIAREKSLEQALREASQLAGVHIQAVSESRDHILTKDEIRMIVNEVIHLVEEPRYSISYEGDEICYQCHVKVSIDTDEVEERLRDEEKSHDDENSNR